MEVILGTYEEFLVGYKILKNEDKGQQLVQSFTNNAHCGSVRCVAVCGKYLASGGTDETVKLCNMNQRVEHGALIHHSGTITCLEFFKDSYLLSGSEDGNICIWCVKNWQCEKTLQGHKKGVSSLSIHPSGKLALSTGKDRTVRTWDLVRGRCAYVLKMDAVPEFVQWSPQGTFYAVGLEKRVEIYSTESAGITCTIGFGHRVNCATFVTNDVVAVAGESESIKIHNIKTKKNMSFEAHKNRVRDVKCVESPSGKPWLFSSSTDGFVKVWKVKNAQAEITCDNLVSTDTGCRITCMAVWLPPQDEETKVDESLVKESKRRLECQQEAEDSSLPVKIRRQDVESDGRLQKKSKKK